MKASELIKELAIHIAEVGDKEVVIEYYGGFATAKIENVSPHYHRDGGVTINIVRDC